MTHQAAVCCARSRQLRHAPPLSIFDMAEQQLLLFAEYGFSTPSIHCAGPDWQLTPLFQLNQSRGSRSREYVTEQFSSFGILSKARQISSLRNARVPSLPRPTYNVEERLLDRLDPAQQLERLARFLWRRRRLATLRGDWMYFYTSLKDGNGLVGINVNTGVWNAPSA